MRPQHNTPQHAAARSNTLQHNTLQHSTPQHAATQHAAARRSTLQHLESAPVLQRPAPCTRRLLLAAPPVKRAAQRALLGSYSYAGSKTARTRFRTHAIAAQSGANSGGNTAQVDVELPGDGGIFCTALLALACGRAMLDVSEIERDSAG